MSGACKTAIGLCVALSLVLLYYFSVYVQQGAKTESLTTDDVAGNVPAQLISGWNPFMGDIVRSSYLAERGWNRDGPKEGMWGDQAWATPLNNGDMRDSPSEISTVNNNVRGANGSDNKESFSSQELSTVLKGRDGMWGGAGESPAFWEPNPHLTLGSYVHSGMDAGPENFTSEQLYASSRGRNAADY